MIGFKIEMARPKLYIGVDPGSTCGIATLQAGSRSPNVYQFKSNIEAMFFVIRLANDWDVELTIEDARLAIKTAYHARTQTKAKDQGVGYVKAYSKEWEAFCQLKGFSHRMVTPNYRITKTSPEYFEQLTGIKTLKGEHHMRDAAMLIIGKR